MRRRSRKNNLPTMLAYSGVLALCIGGIGYAGFQTFGKAVPDRYGCFSEAQQSHTMVVVDASQPRFSTEQKRSVLRYFDQLYGTLGFNDKLSFYTSEGDQLASIAAPRFHICGPAQRPDQLEAINADAGSPGYLEKQRERLYEKVLLPELEAMLADDIETSRHAYESPIFEMIADLSRSPAMKPGSRLVLISDLIQNSDSAQFCQVQNSMPLFSNFEKRRIYERIKPQSLEGVEADVLMLQRTGYGPYCRDEQEIRKFWEDYLIANGVKAPHFIRIRYGRDG